VSDLYPKVCPHLHIPLQSGDDAILRLMGRPYTAGFYRRLVEAVADRIPYCGIGADVMVGFPGEDDTSFRMTFDLLSSLPVTYLHVFSFSRRAGTPAAQFAYQVDPEARKARSGKLRSLAREKSGDFRQALVGRSLRVLVLGRKRGNMTEGLSGNYVRTYFSEPLPANQLVRAEVTGLAGTGVTARLAGK
jgi:threonylcarbamoyladenosine tRNA methylthiotransferase MtaB